MTVMTFRMHVDLHPHDVIARRHAAVNVVWDGCRLENEIITATSLS